MDVILYHLAAARDRADAAGRDALRTYIALLKAGRARPPPRALQEAAADCTDATLLLLVEAELRGVPTAADLRAAAARGDRAPLDYFPARTETLNHTILRNAVSSLDIEGAWRLVESMKHEPDALALSEAEARAVLDFIGE